MPVSVLRKHLGVRVGYKGNVPIYAFACSTRSDGIEKHLGVRLGYLNGVPVYGFSSCLPAMNWKTLAARAGYKSNNPVYLWAGDCCEGPPPGSGSSSSTSSSSTTPCCTACTLPATLTATITDLAGLCACMNGQTVTLTQTPNTCTWVGTSSWLCNGTPFKITCTLGQVGGNCQLLIVVDCNGVVIPPQGQDTFVCAGPVITYNVIVQGTPSTCCPSGFVIKVVVT